ncbi:HipA N-terminal domain-containing protein [Mesorhizobium caraganae]|uniref:HipA N-terminal domain-containing protein n=1 Tax=Mesorhizobium caraganae TaxID=483206 RepID=A0ABV1Z6R5_9HYPH
MNAVKIGTIVRTLGYFNAFNFDDAYRATGGFPVSSLSFRAATGGLRKDPKPLASALPAFFANLLPEEKLPERWKSTTKAMCGPAMISIF